MKTLAKLIAILTLTFMAAVWLVGPASAHAFSLTLDNAPGAAGLFGARTATATQIAPAPATDLAKAEVREPQSRVKTDKARAEGEPATR